MFDFSNLDESRKQRPFLDVLMDMIRRMSKKYEIDIHEYDHGENVKFFFSVFLEDLSAKFGTQVSVLVDEYDAPILNALDSTNLSGEEKRIRADENRQTLRDFFTSLKSMNAYTYRCFTTGLNKFAMRGLFSGADDFMDITFDQWYSPIVGYTWNEIETAYAPLLDQLAETVKIKDREELRKLLRKNYGGYSWLDRGNEETLLFNPWDINNCLGKQMIVPYWTKNGLSSRLIQLLDSNALRQMEWVGEEYSLSHMMSLVELSQFVSYRRSDPARLLLLNGYLTIKSGRFGRRDWVMKIGFPITKLLFRVQLDKEIDSFLLDPLQACLVREDILALFSTLCSVFARTPYHISHQFLERQIHGMLFQMLSVAWGPSRVLAEVPGQESRADLIIETKKGTHIIELKVAPVPNKRKTAPDDDAPVKESSFTADDMIADPKRMSPQLTEAILQVKKRKYENLAQRRKYRVHHYAVVYYSNLKLMDAVEIDRSGEVTRSVWDENIKAEPVVLLANSSIDQENQDSIPAPPYASKDESLL